MRSLDTRKKLGSSSMLSMRDEIMRAVKPIVERYGSEAWEPDSIMEAVIEDHVLSLMDELFVFSDKQGRP